MSRTCYPFVSLLAGGLLASGCVDAAEPTTASVQHAVAVAQEGVPVAPVAKLRVDGDRVSLTGTGWAETAPGIWTGASGSGTGSVIIGAEGHRLAIAKAETELAALHDNGGSDAAIAQHEMYLANLEANALRIPADPSIQAICNIGFVFVPSSLVFLGFPGAFAGAVLDCIDGTVVFTVQAQACTDFGCGAVQTFFTPPIGQPPLLFGTATGGTPGAACSGAAAVTPPGFFSSAAITCG